MITANTTKLERVRSWFEKPNKYLNPRQFDIRIRRETVEDFVHQSTFEKALDIGCGDGSISLPLLHQIAKLTLLDLSTNMLSLAGRNVPSDYSEKVELINTGFLEAKLKDHAFDLIFCIGVLAHVDSPEDVIAEIARIARPGATIILEFTDSFHFWSLPIIVYQNLLKLRRPAPYPLNRLRGKSVFQLCARTGLELRRVYRYSHPPIGTGLFAGHDKQYGMTRLVFGRPQRNKNRWMGNQFICLFRRARRQPGTPMNRADKAIRVKSREFVNLSLAPVKSSKFGDSPQNVLRPGADMLR
jgi:ubiquinone/menaquinone biosynthesis C-methylase UbiE